MVTPVVDSEALDSLTILNNRIQENTELLNTNILGLGSAAENLGNVAQGTLLGEGLKDLSRLAVVGRDEIEKFSQKKIGTLGISETIDSFQKSSKAGTGFFGAIGGAMSALQSPFASFIKNVSGAGAALGAAMIQEDLISSPLLKRFHEIERALMDVDEAAIGIGMSFGTTFREAVASTGMFGSKLTSAIATTKQTREEVLKVSRSLGDTFGPRIFDNMTKFTEANGRINDTVNLVNASMLTASALGLENSETTSIMTTAMLDLGATAEESALAIGQIANAAENSGLSFKRVADSIKSSAQALKMWGGTIGSVSPLFNSFAQSLKGIGREGLTPDLLNSFVRGLDQMQFSTRALLGMQMPGMRGGGAIRAGLEVEEALETGTGMEKMVSGITQTLKNFGGGRVITRQEALRNPALERHFMVQRGLLTKLIPGLDPAKANMLLGIMKDVDRNGLAAAGDAEKKLGELMGSGQQAQEQTTTVLENAQLGTMQAVETAGDRIVNELGGLMQKSGVRSLLQSISGTLMRGIAGGRLGAGSIREFQTRYRGLGREERQRERQLRQAPEEQRPQIQQELNRIKGEKAEVQIRMGAERGAQRWTRDPTQLPLGLGAQERTAARRGEFSTELRANLFKQSADKLLASTQGGPEGDETRQRIETVVAQLVSQLSQQSTKQVAQVVQKQEEQGPPIPPNWVERQQEPAQFNIGDQVLNVQAPTPLSVKSEDEPTPFSLEGQLLGVTATTALPVVSENPLTQSALEQAFMTATAAPLNIVPAPLSSAEQQMAMENALLAIDTPPLSVTMPIDEAANMALGIIERNEKVNFAFSTPDPIEQEVTFKIKVDKQSITIEPDDEHIKKTVRTFISNKSMDQ